MPVCWLFRHRGSSVGLCSGHRFRSLRHSFAVGLFRVRSFSAEPSSVLRCGRSGVRIFRVQVLSLLTHRSYSGAFGRGSGFRVSDVMVVPPRGVPRFGGPRSASSGWPGSLYGGPACGGYLWVPRSARSGCLFLGQLVGRSSGSSDCWAGCSMSVFSFGYPPAGCGFYPPGAVGPEVRR